LLFHFFSIFRSSAPPSFGAIASLLGQFHNHITQLTRFCRKDNSKNRWINKELTFSVESANLFAAQNKTKAGNEFPDYIAPEGSNFSLNLYL
jgi:hypothetical protein